MKNSIWALFIGLALVISVLILANAYKNRNHNNDRIYVTGMSSQDFTSDFIVWNARFYRQAYTLKDAYKLISRDRQFVEKFLYNNGIKVNEIVFDAVRVEKVYEFYYDEKGNYLKRFAGYSLEQAFTVKSDAVEKVETVSREISKLIDQDVLLMSDPPKYYYTKLDELKIQMIAAATENAKIRAEQIAQKSGVKLGKLKEAQLGVFQITGQYSDEDYSWIGTFNTSSKEKTATITVKAEFEIK